MSLPKRSSQSDYSLDPAESTHDPQRIRAVRLDVCLANWGKHFQTSGGAAQCNAADFDLSQVVDFIDDFLSHDWKTSRFDKFLALIWTYNFRAAMFASAIVSCLVGVLRIYFPGNHWWPVCFGYLAFAFTLCFWQRMRSCCCKPPKVFLDRLCIPQDDEILKRQGILGLPSFLHHSERLIILWSEQWISRLWYLFELATFLRKNCAGNSIQLVPVKMGRVLLLLILCWVGIAFCHAVMLDVMNPQFQTSGNDENLPQVRQRLFEFYLLVFSLFGVAVMLTLPSLMFLGQVTFKELAELPVQLKSFRVQDCKCFCCTNSHRDPRTGETLPCDRMLVHRMLAKWFSASDDKEDDLSYLNSFNTVVRDELSLVMSSAGGGTLRFKDALYAAGGCTFPWISDFIPWWANSELTGLSFLVWFLRGFMLWSYNGLVMIITMRFCIILWKVSLGFLHRVPMLVLVVSQAAALLVVVLCVWLPFRWWYATASVGIVIVMALLKHFHFALICKFQRV